MYIEQQWTGIVTCKAPPCVLPCITLCITLCSTLCITLCTTLASSNTALPTRAMTSLLWDYRVVTCMYATVPTMTRVAWAGQMQEFRAGPLFFQPKVENLPPTPTTNIVPQVFVRCHRKTKCSLPVVSFDRGHKNHPRSLDTLQVKQLFRTCPGPQISLLALDNAGENEL